MRNTAKLMMVRTIFDPSVPPTTDLYKTVNQILNLNGEIVRLHPSDGKRVLRALRHVHVDTARLNEMVRSRL